MMEIFGTRLDFVSIKEGNCWWQIVETTGEKYYNFGKGVDILYTRKLRGTATKKTDAFAQIYLRYLQHYKDTTNVFGSTLALIGYFLK